MTALTDGQISIDTFTFDEHVRPQCVAYPVKDSERRADFSGGQEEMPIRVVNAVNDNPIPQVTTVGVRREAEYSNTDDVSHPAHHEAQAHPGPHPSDLLHRMQLHR